MTKLGYVLSPVFVFALAFSAFAQGNERPVNTDKSETVKVNVSGEINVDGVFRSADLMGSRGASAGVNSSSRFTVEGWLRLRLDIELTEKVSAVLSLRNQRIGAGDSLPSTVVDGPAGDNTSVFGSQGTGLIVDKATVSFNEFFTAGLKLTVGIDPETAFDLRGKGSAFFFDPAHSHSMTKNATDVVFGEVAGGGFSSSYYPDQLQPAGLHLVYGKDMLNLGMFLLPATIHAGTNATSDEAAYGAWFTYGLEISGNKQSKVGLLFVYDNLPGKSRDIFTIGGGADIHNLVEGLELYAELYFQFGKVGETATTSTSARGWAFQLGGQYNLPKNENDIWFGLNFTYVSGDDSGSPDTTTPDADRNKNFLSYENVNDLLIVEDQVYGVDVDSNYWAIKGGVGGSLKVGSAATNNLHLSLGLGYARLVHSIGAAAADEAETLGFEIDPTIAYDVNKQVSAYTKFGVLFSSDVLAKWNGGGPGSSGTDASETVWTWVLGVDAKF